MNPTTRDHVLSNIAESRRIRESVQQAPLRREIDKMLRSPEFSRMVNESLFSMFRFGTSYLKIDKIDA